MNHDNEGPTAVITGMRRGAGESSARSLAAHGSFACRGKLRAAIRAIAAAGLIAAAAANVCVAKIDGAISVVSGAADSDAPRHLERSGSLAVYPLLY